MPYDANSSVYLGYWLSVAVLAALIGHAIAAPGTYLSITFNVVRHYKLQMLSLLVNFIDVVTCDIVTCDTVTYDIMHYDM